MSIEILFLMAMLRENLTLSRVILKSVRFWNATKDLGRTSNNACRSRSSSGL